MRALNTIFAGLAVLVAIAAFNGCDTADEVFDCQQVCSRYKDCYEPGYDVASCRSRCRTRSESDSSVRSAADQCEACIGDKSCLSATFSCPICLNIVP